MILQIAILAFFLAPQVDVLGHLAINNDATDAEPRLHVVEVLGRNRTKERIIIDGNTNQASAKVLEPSNDIRIRQAT